MKWRGEHTRSEEVCEHEVWQVMLGGGHGPPFYLSGAEIARIEALMGNGSVEGGSERQTAMLPSWTVVG